MGRFDVRQLRVGEGIRATICGRISRRLIVAACGVAFAVVAPGTASALTYTVDSTGDTADVALADGICADASGRCTLRAAIEQANASSDVDDAVRFALLGPSPHTIEVATELPAIRDTLDLDAAANVTGKSPPVVILKGGRTEIGLRVVAGADGSTVRGLAVTDFLLGIEVSARNTRIEANYVGLLPDGTLGYIGTYGIGLDAGGNVVRDNVVTLGAANIAVTAGGNTIAGNFLGTSPDGTSLLGGGTAIDIFSGSPGPPTVIGGDNPTPDQGCTGDCNLIAGSVMAHAPAVISGNFVGTDVSGRSLLELSSIGFQAGFAGTIDGVVVGGVTPARRNLVTGAISLAGVSGATISGNYVGTDGTGTVLFDGRGSVPTGVALQGETSNILIGGVASVGVPNACTGACNLLPRGISIANHSNGVVVEGNFIGTDISGLRPPTGSEDAFWCGVRFSDERSGSAPSTDNTIRRNRIGFGGGVSVSAGTRNRITENAIFANPLLGIDLNAGCAPALGRPDADNDAGDVDTGANEGQNFPVITGVSVAGGRTTVTGTLTSRPDTTYRVEFFRNAPIDGFTETACDPSYYGEGQEFVGAVDVTTNAEGHRSFSYGIDRVLGSNEAITATATDPDGNTSEFSECLADLAIEKTGTPDPVGTGETLTYTLTVRNEGPAPAPRVFVRDTLPAVLVVLVQPSQGVCAPAPALSAELTCELGEIGRGESATVTVTVKAPLTPETLTNAAAVADVDEPDPNDRRRLVPRHDPDPSNNFAEVTTVVEARGRIVVRKQTVPAGAAEMFAFTSSYGGSFTLADGQSKDSGPLRVGTGYSVAETPLAGWKSTATCDDGSDVGNIDVGSGETVTCTFTNEDQRGTIVFRKQTIPAGLPDAFTFASPCGTFAIGDAGARACRVAAGSWDVTEADAAGFALTAVRCDDDDSSGSFSTRTATYRVGANETVTCTFTNLKLATVGVVKTLLGAPLTGDASFRFELRVGASPTAAGLTLASVAADAANGGLAPFRAGLPPGSFQLCELVLPGWRTSLTGTFTPGGVDPLADNSVVCVDFQLSAGEIRSFAVDNTPPPGGLARTIGFWKNWASCSSSHGNQRPVLDQSLAAAEPAGIAIGLLTLHANDCLAATRLLNKSTVDSARKQASDPAYNLAAQLVAAKLNGVAGAATCLASNAAVVGGDSLLTSLGFVGSGAYATGMSATQKSTAGSLASLLDRYNNNLLC